MKIEVHGYIEKGELKILGRTRMEAAIKEAKDCDVVVVIKKRGKRSQPQNNFYWGVIIQEIRAEFKNRGIKMDNEEVHEFLKLHFNKQYIHDEHGEVIGEYGGSTATMSKEEMMEYLDRIILWCAEKLSLAISEPNTQTELFQFPKAA
jgi:hypothetical protein